MGRVAPRAHQIGRTTSAMIPRMVKAIQKILRSIQVDCMSFGERANRVWRRVEKLWSHIESFSSQIERVEAGCDGRIRAWA
jgi:hypothetical protein